MENEDLPPQKVLARFVGTPLTRDLLLRWAKQGFIKAKRIEQGRGSRDMYLYPEAEMPQLSWLLWGHSLGLMPELSLRLTSMVGAGLDQPSDDALVERFRELFRAIQEIPSIALTGTGSDDFEQIVTTGNRFIPSECCSVFLVEPEVGPVEASQCLRLVSQSLGPFEDTAIKLNDTEIGLTGGLAKRAKPIAVHGVTLKKHPLLRNGPPRHLPSRETWSLMIVPVLDRHRRLRGCLKFENKTGSGGRVLEDAFFDPFDQAIARILASQTMIGLENRAIRSATTDLMRQAHEQLKLSAYLAKVLHHAMQLVGGDFGDVFWRGHDDKFEVLSQQGPSAIDVGAEPPTPSVARRVADSGKPELIRDVENVPYYAKCRLMVQSEVAVPMMRGDRCVAVLNIESRMIQAFDSHDVSTLQYLADHAIPEVEAVYRRDEVYKSLEEILGAMEKHGRKDTVMLLVLKGLMHSGFDRARVFEYQHKESAFVCAGSVGLRERDGKYAGVQLPISSSRYVELTVRDAKRSPISVQVRKPDKDGVDPNCELLGKRPDLPWVVYPLVRNRHLLGYIAADNHVSGDPFTPTLLENLPLFGLLAARAMLHKKKAAAMRR